MAHNFWCSCKKCNPSFTDMLFGTSTSKKGPFYNRGSSDSPKVKSSPRYGPNQHYYGGKGKNDGPGHGHYNPNNGFNRKPVTDFLGNTAIRGTTRPTNNTPKW